jgi:hypothetical protein
MMDETIRVHRQRLLAIISTLEGPAAARTVGGQRRMRHGGVSTSAILMTRALAHVANTTRRSLTDLSRRMPLA